MSLVRLKRLLLLAGRRILRGLLALIKGLEYAEDGDVIYVLRSNNYVEVEKARSHSGIRENEIVGSLAVDAARSDID